MSIMQKLAKSTAIQILGKAVSTLIGVIIIGLMTRQLGQAGFGAYATAMAFLQMFALLLDLGLNVTFIALLGEHTDDAVYEKRCISALFTLRILIACTVLGILAPTITFFLPYPTELKLAIIALTGSFIFPGINQIVIGVQQKHLRMTASAIAENIGRLVVLMGLFIAQALGLGLIPIMWIISLGSFFVFTINFLSVRSYGAFYWNWDPDFWKSALARSWPIGLSIALNLIYFKTDTLILERYRPLAEVGIYGAAYRVLELLITVPFMYAGVLLPILAHAWKRAESERLGRLITHSLEAMMILIAPMVAGILVLGPSILTIVAGEAFALSGTVLKVLILAVAVIYLNTILAHVVVAIHKQRQMIPIYFLAAILTFTGYLFLIPRYGMWAAAWLTVFSELLIGLWNLFVTHKTIPIQMPWRVPLASLGAATIMGSVCWALLPFGIWISLFSALFVYPFFLFIFGGISRHTIRDLLTIEQTAVPTRG